MVGDFERLAQEFVNPQAQLHYRVCGGQDKRGRPQLHCKVDARLEMVCQRCLNPVDVAVASERVLYLAESEAEAERLETVLADADIEVLVTGRALDLAGVVEDEVLLSLPLVPAHDTCSVALPTED